MHTLVESPALGLTQVFLRMARARGFPIPEESSLAQGYFEPEFAQAVGDALEDLGVAYSDTHFRSAAQLGLGLSTHAVPRPAPPQCYELQVVRGAPVEAYPAPYDVTREVLDGFTLCFTCFFPREGMRDLHCIESLNRIRVLVAEGIKLLGKHLGQPFIVKDCLLGTGPERSMWARYDAWKCLAQARGEHQSKIDDTVSLARRSRIAS